MPENAGEQQQPRPSHVLKGHSSLAEGSPRSGYSGDQSPPSASALKGLASTGHHPEPPCLSPLSDLPPRATTTRSRHAHPDRGDRTDPGVERSDHPRSRPTKHASIPKVVPDGAGEQVQKDRKCLVYSILRPALPPSSPAAQGAAPMV